MQEVVDRTGKYPDHYSLFTNIHLIHEDKEGLEASIRNGFERERIVTVNGAAELAVAVNDLPHIRSAFFSTTQFATWSAGWENHNKTSISGRVPKLVGKDQAAAEIRRVIDDDVVRVVVVTGGPSLGNLISSDLRH